MVRAWIFARFVLDGIDGAWAVARWLLTESSSRYLNPRRKRNLPFRLGGRLGCEMRWVLLLVLLGSIANAADWPMWRYDVGRTAESPQQVPDKLALLWHRDLPQPEPAFNDVRLQFDGGYEPVVSGKRLFLSPDPKFMSRSSPSLLLSDSPTLSCCSNGSFKIFDEIVSAGRRPGISS